MLFLQPRNGPYFFDRTSKKVTSLQFEQQEFLMQEDYVPRSPSGKCFEAFQRFIIERTSVLYNPTLLIRIAVTKSEQ